MRIPSWKLSRSHALAEIAITRDKWREEIEAGQPEVEDRSIPCNEEGCPNQTRQGIEIGSRAGDSSGRSGLRKTGTGSIFRHVGQSFGERAGTHRTQRKMPNSGDLGRPSAREPSTKPRKSDKQSFRRSTRRNSQRLDSFDFVTSTSVAAAASS
jgi:hypothetical protein